MTASRFHEARLTCGLSQADTAKLLRVTERTLQNWESGRVRVPYAAYKLMRILRGGELPFPEWKGYRIDRDTLWSPEGRPFRPADMAWWSLTCRMAAEFRILVQVRHQLADGPKPVLKRLPDAPAASVGSADPDQFPQPLLATASLPGRSPTTVPEVACRCLTLPNRPDFTASHLSLHSALQPSALLVGGAS